MKQRLLLGVVLLLLALPVLVVAQDNTTVTTAFTESQPNTLDPHAARIADEFLVMRNVCEGLVNYDPVTLEPVPALAESWEISEDGLVYTFNLRDGVTFFDGSTLDAADVKYSFDRLSDPAIGTSYTAGLILRDVAGWAEARPVAPRVEEGTPTPEPIPPALAISGVAVVDDMTVSITLSKPVTSFLVRLTLPGGIIIPDGSAAGVDFLATGPTCTGPYMVSEWILGDSLTLVANENYWGGAPDVKQAIIRVIPEVSTQVIEFEAGNLDIVTAPPSDLTRIREDAALSEALYEVATLSNFNIRINLKDPKMGDVRVRKALSMAIDRQAIVDSVLAGQGVPAVGLYPPGLSTHDPDFNPFPRDIEAIKALLTEAGYPDGIELSIRNDQEEVSNRVINAIAATVAEAGITLNLVATEASVYTEDRTACTMEMGYIRWTMDYPDPENMTVLLLPNAATRVNCGYGDVDVAAQIGELVGQGVSMPLGEERDAIFREVEQIAMDAVLIIPIYHGVSTSLVNPRLGGQPVDNNGTRRFMFIELD
jgi:ABC-type transport system substrate-binding protein